MNKTLKLSNNYHERIERKMKISNKIKKVKIFELSLLIAMIISVALSVADFSHNCDNIRDKLLRMHVIANSDSPGDQELKLKVRDAVLAAGREYFDGSVDVSQAENVLKPKTDELASAAKKVIEENGFDYDVKVNIGKADFLTRKYDNGVTLPAGEYEAVNVVIGEGKGHNWWCVMFPPMCLPAAQNDVSLEDVLTDDELKIVQSDVKYEPRFKIIEFLEKITGKI